MDNIKNLDILSYHEGRPVCAACGGCSKHTGIMFCKTCKRNVHNLCHIFAKQQPNKEGYCQECRLMPNNHDDLQYSEWMRRLIRCGCIQPGTNASVFAQSNTSNFSIMNIAVSGTEPGIIPKIEDSTTGCDSIKVKNTLLKLPCRRSERSATTSKVIMPDRFRIMGEYFNEVMKEDADLDDNEDNIERDTEMITEVDDDSDDEEEEPLFALRDRVVYLHDDEEIVRGTIIGRVLNANVTTDFVQGCELPPTQCGWSYAVKTKDAEDGDADYLRWKHEVSLVFDTGDDHGTGSDEEELENTAE